MNPNFFTFIKPYLSYIDNGNLYRKPFSYLYLIIGVINLLFPIYILYEAVNNQIFDMPTKFVILFLLVWVVIAFASWVSFQIWWDRKSRITMVSTESDDFIATPVFSHFLQTFGEWLGTWVTIVGFCVSLLITIIIGGEGALFVKMIGVPFIQTSFVSVILFPVYGFLIIVFTRFLAEQCRALVSIANNTGKR